MEYMNQTYEAVDSQPRPVSYIHPFTIRNDCVDEENYETLTEIQTQFNIYERPPVVEEAKEPTKSKPNVSDIKKVDTWDCEGTEIMKIKQDLRKTKVSVIILASFVIVFLITSVIAVALAVTIPLHNTTDGQSLIAGPQAQLGQNNLSRQGINDSTLQIIANVSSEFDVLRDIVNASAWKLTSELSKFMNQTRGNHSNSLSKLEDLRNDLTSKADQLHRLIQQMSNRSNATSLEDQLTTIQTNANTLSTQLNNLGQQLNLTQSNVTLVSNLATTLQVSLNNHLSSPLELYQNCHQDITSCSVTRLINNNRRIFCSTPSLNASITVGK